MSGRDGRTERMTGTDERSGDDMWRGSVSDRPELLRLFTITLMLYINIHTWIYYAITLTVSLPK